MATTKTRKASPAKVEAIRAEVADFKARADAFEAETDEADLAEIVRRFPQYSEKNNIMIHLQMPTAKVIYAYRAWQDQGRQVLAGQQGIRIWAPAGRATDEMAADGTVAKEGRKFFRLVSVFDVSQTEDAAVLARQKAEAEAAAQTLTTAAAFGDLVSA